MRIATVRMSWLTTRLKIETSSVRLQAPCHQVQDVLGQLSARPLVPVHDGQVHDDRTEGFAADAMAFDARIPVAGPGQDPFGAAQEP